MPITAQSLVQNEIAACGVVPSVAPLQTAVPTIVQSLVQVRKAAWSEVWNATAVCSVVPSMAPSVVESEGRGPHGVRSVQIEGRRAVLSAVQTMAVSAAGAATAVTVVAARRAAVSGDLPGAGIRHLL